MKTFYSLSISIFLALFFSVLLVGNLEAANYYIDGSSGKDDNPGTIELQWKTIGKANSMLKASDTVYIKGGSYLDSINPANSGSPGKPITFARYGLEVVSLVNKIGVLMNNKDYIVLDGFTFSSGNNAVRATDCNNCELKNWDISGASRWAAVDLTACDYWWIHDNMIGTNSHTGIQLLRCDYCVVEDNVFSDVGDHSCMELAINSKHNIVRNNTFRTTGVLSYNDGVDTMLMVLQGSNYNLFEKNTFYESGSNIDDDKCAAFKMHNSSYNILRQNLVYSIDLFAFLIYTSDNNTQVAEKNTIYHNTIYDCGKYYGGIVESGALMMYRYSGLSVRYNRWVNNIVHRHGQHAFGWNAVGGSDYVYDNVFENNIISIITLDDVNRFKTRHTIANAQEKYPSEFFGQITLNPKMADPSSQDFALLADSPAVDAGTYLATITTASGSGTSFNVDHPEFFCDGYGISGVTGDSIKTIDVSTPTNDKQVAIITALNYSTGSITVDTPISWTQNLTRIALDYSGSGPDVGCYELQSLPKKLSLTIE